MFKEVLIKPIAVFFLSFFLTQPTLIYAQGNADKQAREERMNQAQVHYNMAESRLKGSVKLEDYVLAIQEYRKSQLLGSVMASDRLVQLMRTLPADPTLQALYRDKLAKAKEGDVEAQYLVAQMCEFGIGVNADFARAVFWYKQADELDYGAAQNRLAELYTQGLIAIDESVSETRVFEWIQSAAKNNQADAQYKLAKIYRDGGVLVTQDEAKAFYWYEQAAKNGLAEAQMESGLMLKEGKGVKQDYDKALYWFEQAEKQGYEPAVEQVKEVNTILDDIFLQNFKYK